MWTQVLYYHSNIVCKRITITFVNGYLTNHVEGHECPRWDLSLLITWDISLGLLMKYDCKIAWPYRIKSIWDIGLIRYSIYFVIMKYKYWSIQGWQNLCLVINIYIYIYIYIWGQRSNCAHEHYHGKCFVRSLDIHVTWVAVMCY